MNIDVDHYHYRIFQLRCYERGMEFQRFFEKIMMKHDNAFTPIKPHGREGDWKCDGWISSSGTLFQVYAPESPEAAKFMSKIRADFAGAVAKWKKMRKWVLVYAGEHSLPPMVAALIESLREENRNLTIETWGIDRLWGIIRDLPLESRNGLLEPVPISLTAVNSESRARTRLEIPKGQTAPAVSLEKGTGLVMIEGSDGPLGAAFCFLQRQFVATTSFVASTVKSVLQSKGKVSVTTAHLRFPLEVEKADFDPSLELGWLRLATGAGRLTDLAISSAAFADGMKLTAIIPRILTSIKTSISFDYVSIAIIQPQSSVPPIAVMQPGCQHLKSPVTAFPGSPLFNGAGHVVGVISEEIEPSKTWRVASALRAINILPIQFP